MPERYRQALYESEWRFRTMVEKNVDAIMILRENGVVCFANPAAEKLLNNHGGELVGQCFGIPLTPDDYCEIDLPQADGEPRIADLRVVQTTWEGEPAYLASLHDITERRRAAEAMQFLAEASRLLAGSLDMPRTIETVARLAVEHLADWCAIDLVEPDHEVRRVATRHVDPGQQALANRLIGPLPFDRMFAAGLPRVLASGEPQIYAEIDDELRQTLAATDEQLAIIKQLGCRSIMLTPLTARGEIIGSILFCSAAANRYLATDLALAKDLANRAALAIDNARLYDQSQDAIRRRDEFLAMLAHELRNPLAAIQSSVDVMRAGADQPRQARARDVIERQGQHMARLLSELLDIARVTRGKIVLQREPFELRTVIEDALQAVGTAAAAGQQEVRVVLPPEPITIDGDATRIKQVIVNLLDNAIKYTPPRGQLALAVSLEEQHVVIEVKDSGVGIAVDDLPYIFDPFVQANRTLDRCGGGLGIGLTLVRTLVDMHGGEVLASSSGRDRGSEFTVRLPLATPTINPAPAAVRRSSEKLKQKIVIVEDNDDARDMLKMLLEMEGHEVHTAEDGLAGIALILGNQPDIALVDIGLPGVDGYGVAQKVRAETGSSVRLVAVTGFGQREDSQRVAAAGFDQHLIKPVRLDALLDVLALESKV